MNRRPFEAAGFFAPVLPYRVRPYTLVMDWRDHIHRDPAILAGKPVFKGTRLSVAFILQHLGAGWTNTELFDAFPRLTVEHLRAAQACVADLVADSRIVLKGVADAPWKG